MGSQSKNAKSVWHYLQQRWMRVLLAAIALAGLFVAGIRLHQIEPNYYSPARSSLISARQKIIESYNHESDMLKQMKTTHQELENAIAALNKARVDAATTAKIDAIKVRLRSLEDVDHLENTSPRALLQTYREIEGQMSEIIDLLEQQKPSP